MSTWTKIQQRWNEGGSDAVAGRLKESRMCLGASLLSAGCGLSGFSGNQNLQ